jgi:prepilin-type N-terminal cleavage/methylation domain-containing protein
MKLLVESIRDKRAFTLIELLIVLAILTVLALASAPIYTNLSVSTQSLDSSNDIVGALRSTQVKARARKNNSKHGIYFNTLSNDDSYTIFEGQSYAMRDSSKDLIINLDQGISVSTDLTNDELVFSLGQGLPYESGSITIITNSGVNIIDINSKGLIEVR